MFHNKRVIRFLFLGSQSTPISNIEVLRARIMRKL